METNDIATLLVVDDNPHLLRAQSRILEAKGYRVLQAADAEEGLDLVQKHSPDMVLLDVNLPGIDGLEACKKIKAGNEKTFVVLLSSMKTSSDQQADGLESGADGYISRPVSNRELVARVRAMFRIKQTEDALRKSEHKCRSIVENAGLGIVVLDRDGIVVSANPAFCRMTGFDEKDLVGCTPPYPYWPEDAHEAERRRLERLLTRGRLQGETRRRKKDGSVFHASTTASAIVDENGDPEFFIDIVQDISDKKRAEDALLREKKLEAVGSMVGGMSHDLNNLLSVILGNIDLSQMDAHLDTELYQNLSYAREACILTRDLIVRYLSFSDPKSLDLTPGDVRKAVADAADSFSSITEAKIRVSLSDTLWPAKFDYYQLKKVLEEMIENSLEAMGGAGVANIRAENADLSGDNAEPGLAEGRYIKISILDSGPGIAQEHMPNIFDPYFSTKQKGTDKGIGFGLAMAYAIVASHEGDIRVSSPPGGGAEFSIYIPAL